MIEFDKTEKAMSKSGALTHYFRRMILEGKMKVGEALPSTQALAKELDMSPGNAQRALSALVHEQLIERKPHFGTFVRGIQHTLKLAAIIDFYKNNTGYYAYETVLCTGIATELRKRGCNTITLLEDVDHLDFAALEKKLHSLQVQAIIPLSAPAKVIQRLKAINMPLATNSGVFKDNGVYPDFATIPDLAEQVLKKEHCSRPGIISSINFDPEKFHYAKSTNRMLNKGLALLQKYSPDGAQLLKKYPKLPEEYSSVNELTEFAYNSAKALLTIPNPVDSLIVYSDCLCDGVIQAVLESRTAPLLIFYRNKELPYFYPQSAYFLSISLHEMAVEMVNILYKQFNGEKTTRKMIPLQIVEPNPEGKC